MKKEFEIEFYEDNNGFSDVAEYIKKLSLKKDKDSKINFTKIVAYLDVLAKNGNSICYPFVRHIENDIWELRPLDNRFMYAYVKNHKIIILSHFIKKTKKTPKLELKKAQTRLIDYLNKVDYKGGK